MKKIIWPLLFLFIYSAAVSAQKRAPQPVKVHFVSAENASAGSAMEPKLEIDIDPGWHIFSEKPEIEGIKATQIALEPSEAYSVSKISFPKPETISSPIFNRDLSLYRNKISIDLAITAKAAGEIPIKGTLTFQACSDKLCLPPSKQVFSGTQVVR